MSRFKGIVHVVRKVMAVGAEAAGLNVCTKRKQKVMNANSQQTLYFSFRISAYEMVPCIAKVSPTQST